MQFSGRLICECAFGVFILWLFIMPYLELLLVSCLLQKSNLMCTLFNVYSNNIFADFVIKGFFFLVIVTLMARTVFLSFSELVFGHVIVQYLLC